MCSIKDGGWMTVPKGVESSNLVRLAPGEVPQCRLPLDEALHPASGFAAKPKCVCSQGSNLSDSFVTHNEQLLKLWRWDYYYYFVHLSQIPLSSAVFYSFLLHLSHLAHLHYLIFLLGQDHILSRFCLRPASIYTLSLTM